MHPNSKRRRVHSAEFKATILTACREPGASVAAVALSHGLNVNLVRKWLVGRGLKRASLQVQSAAAQSAAPGVSSAEASTPAAIVSAAVTPALQFVPVALSSAADGDNDGIGGHDQPPPPAGSCADIHIELRRGTAQLTVRWPSSQAGHCAAWLRELAATALK